MIILILLMLIVLPVETTDIHMAHLNVKQSWLPVKPAKTWCVYIDSDIYQALWYLSSELFSYSNVYFNMHTILQEWFFERMSSHSVNKHLPIGTITCQGVNLCKPSLPFIKYNFHIKVHEMLHINVTFHNFQSIYRNIYHCETDGPKALRLDSGDLHYGVLCGAYIHQWSIFTSNNNFRIHNSGHYYSSLIYGMHISYQVIDKESITSINSFPLTTRNVYMKYFSHVLDTLTKHIYHYLLQTEKIFYLDIHINITISYVESLYISLYDGPGSKSSVIFNNVNSSTNATCSTFQCYAVLEQGFHSHGDINQSQLITFCSKQNITNIFVDHQVVPIPTNVNLSALYNSQLVYQLFTNTEQYLMLSISVIYMVTSNILGCTYGGVAVMERMQNTTEFVTHLNLCGMDISTPNPLTIISSSNSMFVSVYQYHPYSNIAVNLEVATHLCKGIFLNIFLKDISSNTYPIFISSQFTRRQVTFVSTIYQYDISVHLFSPQNVCYFLQSWPVDDITNFNVSINLMYKYMEYIHLYVNVNNFEKESYQSVLDLMYTNCGNMDDNEYFGNISKTCMDNDCFCKGKVLSGKTLTYTNRLKLWLLHSLLIHVEHTSCLVPCNSIGMNLAHMDKCDMCHTRFINVELGMYCGLPGISIVLISMNNTCRNVSMYITYRQYVNKLKLTSEMELQPGQMWQIECPEESTICISSNDLYQKCSATIIPQKILKHLPIPYIGKYATLYGIKLKTSSFRKWLIIPNLLSWIEAEAVCQMNGGHLLSIHTEGDVYSIIKLVLTQIYHLDSDSVFRLTVPAIYIGLYCSQSNFSSTPRSKSPKEKATSFDQTGERSIQLITLPPQNIYSYGEWPKITRGLIDHIKRNMTSSSRKVSVHKYPSIPTLNSLFYFL